MKTADVVIGLNYGDEGKGLTVDALAATLEDSKSVAVVRFNGGCQAGHTVVLDGPSRTIVDGKRHIFHHFGAGTFRGAATILSRFFIVNPIVYLAEARELAAHKIANPRTYVDPMAPVTTPYEVAINRALEKARDQKHGSCGMGIGETIEREESGVNLRVVQLKAGKPYVMNGVEQTYSVMLRNRLERVREHFEDRVALLGLEIDEDLLARELDAFVHDAAVFINCVKLANDVDVFELYDHIIFEGAQGLSLDQNSSDFPHVTRSNTGLQNVAMLLDRFEGTIEIYYVTRAFLTRHGAGPLKNEVECNLLADKTNIYNEHQGSLRYAKLDYDRLRSNVETDIEFLVDHSYNITAVVTWCDLHSYIDNELTSVIVERVAEAINANGILVSYGATKESLRLHISDTWKPHKLEELALLDTHNVL